MELITYGYADRLEQEHLAQKLAAIEQECFSDPWSEASMQSALQTPSMQLFTAEDAGEVMGYLMLLSVAPEGEILNLAVSPRYRRQGVAQRLFDACEAFCKTEQIDTLFLEVRASNLPALSLYRKNGFEVLGIRKNYYSNPKENAIVMRCTYEVPHG